MSSEKIVCIASGPSLTQDDIEYVKTNAMVIAINDVYKQAPWADVLYGCDRAWWDLQYKSNLNEISAFRGNKYSLQYDKNKVQKLEIGATQGLEREWPKLATGKNSGHQAVNLAYHLWAKEIILLGYDMQMTNNQVHYFGKHMQPLKNPEKKLMKFWVKKFETLVKLLHKEGVEVINCSRETAISEKICKRAKLRDIF